MLVLCGHKGAEGAVSHVQVVLADDLEGRVHGQHGHADVHHGDAAAGHLGGHRCRRRPGRCGPARRSAMPRRWRPSSGSGSPAARRWRRCSALATAAGVLEEGHAPGRHRCRSGAQRRWPSWDRRLRSRRPTGTGWHGRHGWGRRSGRRTAGAASRRCRRCPCR